MKIVSTFTVIEDSLYAVKYEQEKYNEFNKLFTLWNNAEYLDNFFSEHKEDLNRPYWGGINPSDAILKTRKDAKLLEKKILQVAQRGKTDKDETLSTLFKPLHKDPLNLDPYEKNKAYGLVTQSWLRIYAIRINVNLFVVSGGSIKLTPNMNEREHLLLELKKLEITQKYCKDELDLDLRYFEMG
ncbi:MAG: hypothetical protein EA361_10555 [Bacteroidetes bacterium]|nr:MAG: hypothetical protein EA361_10555 [Bacteroidota bacterium]